jgi:hypothetical protein
MLAVGAYLSMRVLAALYRVADLWYRIGADWPRVARGIVGWGGTALAVALLAPGGRRAAFLYGLGGYAALHVVLYVATRAFVRGRLRARRRDL